MNKISTLNTTNKMILYIMWRAMFRVLQNKPTLKPKHIKHTKKQNQINNKPYQYNYSTGTE